MKLNSWLIAVIATLLSETELSKACDTDGVIRLVDGRNKFEGRVEVCRQGQWKTVCDDEWGNQEAEVVCRQLGFSGNLNPVPETNISAFGVGSGEIIKMRWKCAGTETTLLNCSTDSKMMKCNSHDRDAGVYCFGRSPDDCDEPGAIRLADSDESSGRVEVCLGGLWGTVCHREWDSNDATTVCRQLGYNDTKIGIPTRDAYFGEGSGPIHLSRAQCSNRDTNLTNCTIDKTGINGCDHSKDAGVICMGTSSCSDGDVRLDGGASEREGRVEICYSGVWGTVCADNGWDEADANVACRQLGYRQPATISNTFGVGEGPTLLFDTTCNHTHSELSQCVHPESIGLRECISQDKRAGVICPELAFFPTSTISPSVSYTVITTQRKLSTDVFSTVSTDREERLQIILPVVGGVLALVIIAAISISLIGVMMVWRRKSDNNLGENFEIGLKENEAYGLVANDVKRQKNEAYGGQATHGIETQKNEAYGQVTRDITILTNEAYGAFQSKTEDCYITIN